MSLDKMKQLAKYIDKLKERSASDTPEKHANREKSYRDFLKKEIELAEKTLQELKNPKGTGVL
jgi:hypothetical protein